MEFSPSALHIGSAWKRVCSLHSHHFLRDHCHIAIIIIIIVIVAIIVIDNRRTDRLTVKYECLNFIQMPTAELFVQSFSNQSHVHFFPCRLSFSRTIFTTVHSFKSNGKVAYCVPMNQRQHREQQHQQQQEQQQPKVICRRNSLIRIKYFGVYRMK